MHRYMIQICAIGARLDVYMDMYMCNGCGYKSACVCLCTVVYMSIYICRHVCIDVYV